MSIINSFHQQIHLKYLLPLPIHVFEFSTVQTSFISLEVSPLSHWKIVTKYSKRTQILILIGYLILDSLLTGFRNTSSQIAASFTQNSKYVVSASEDSQVYVWKHEEHRHSASGKRNLVSTASYEHFQCKDVSVAIPWPGTIKGEPPTTLPLHSKRHSKRSSSQPASACNSPTREDIAAASNSRKHLPPLPKKSTTENSNLNVADEELGLISRFESEPNIDESFNSDASSTRYGDSPSISATAATPSSTWSSSWSWFDYVGGGHGSHTIQATAWGMVIVTAGLGGEIRAYQNFGLPRKVGRQTSLFGGPT